MPWTPGSTLRAPAAKKSSHSTWSVRPTRWASSGWKLQVSAGSSDPRRARTRPSERWQLVMASQTAA